MRKLCTSNTLVFRGGGILGVHWSSRGGNSIFLGGGSKYCQHLLISNHRDQYAQA